jgi:hypothetical protein
MALALVQVQPVAAVTWQPQVEIRAEYTRPAGTNGLVVTGVERVHVLFDTGVQNESDLIYRRSGDGGLTWSEPMALSPASHDARAQTIRRFGLSTLDVLWVNTKTNRLFHRRSLNNGFDWDPQIQVAQNVALAADVARFGEHVTVVYTGTDNKIRARVSTNGGESFGSAIPLGSVGVAARLGTPTVLNKNGTITVAWFNTPSPGQHMLLVRQSSDGGATWSPARSLKGPDSATPARSGQLALFGAGAKKIIVGYSVLVGRQDYIHAAAQTSLDGGAHWQPERLVGGNWSEGPRFAYTGGVLRTSYFTCDGFDCPTAVVKFKTSEDFGLTWTPSSIVTPSPEQYTESAGVGALATGQSVVTYTFGLAGLYARTTE